MSDGEDRPGGTESDGGWPARLGEAFAASAPERIALLGPAAAALGAEAATRQAGPGGVVRFASAEDCLRSPPEARTADLALLTLDAEPPGAIDRALGTACRLYPARLLLLVGADAPDRAGAPPDALPPERLFAFGFRRVLLRPDGALHEYRLRDYKLPPDWLNARFWANPERFALDADGEAVSDDEGDEEEEEDDEE